MDISYSDINLSRYKNSPSLHTYKLLYQIMCYIYHQPYILIIYPTKSINNMIPLTSRENNRMQKSLISITPTNWAWKPELIATLLNILYYVILPWAQLIFAMMFSPPNNVWNNQTSIELQRWWGLLLFLYHLYTFLSSWVTSTSTWTHMPITWPKS